MNINLRLFTDASLGISSGASQESIKNFSDANDITSKTSTIVNRSLRTSADGIAFSDTSHEDYLACIGFYNSYLEGDYDDETPLPSEIFFGTPEPESPATEMSSAKRKHILIANEKHSPSNSSTEKKQKKPSSEQKQEPTNFKNYGTKTIEKYEERPKEYSNNRLLNCIGVAKKIVSTIMYEYSNNSNFPKISKDNFFIKNTVYEMLGEPKKSKVRLSSDRKTSQLKQVLKLLNNHAFFQYRDKVDIRNIQDNVRDFYKRYADALTKWNNGFDSSIESTSRELLKNLKQLKKDISQ